jgi:hypothetical protein
MGVRAVRAVAAMIGVLIVIEDMFLVKLFFVGRHDGPERETKENPLGQCRQEAISGQGMRFGFDLEWK